MADLLSMGFAKAPKTMLLNSDISDRAFRLGVYMIDLVALSGRTYGYKYHFAGDKALGKALGISPRTIQRGIKELSEKGYIKKAYIPIPDTENSFRIIYVGEAPDKFVDTEMKASALANYHKKSKRIQRQIMKGEYTEDKTIEAKVQLNNALNLEKLQAMKKVHGLGKKRL